MKCCNYLDCNRELDNPDEFIEVSWTVDLGTAGIERVKQSFCSWECFLTVLHHSTFFLVRDKFKRARFDNRIPTSGR